MKKKGIWEVAKNLDFIKLVSELYKLVFKYHIIKSICKFSDFFSLKSFLSDCRD